MVKRWQPLERVLPCMGALCELVTLWSFGLAGGVKKMDGYLVRHGLFKFELYCKISLVLAGSWFCGQRSG